MVAAMAKVREAVRIMEQTLPDLEIGSDQHDAVITALKALTKAYPATEEMPGIQNSALMGLQRDAREGAAMQQLMRVMQGGGGGGLPGMQAEPPGGAPQMGTM
jgi:hypothetical protein